MGVGFSVVVGTEDDIGGSSKSRPPRSISLIPPALEDALEEADVEPALTLPSGMGVGVTTVEVDEEDDDGEKSRSNPRSPKSMKLIARALEEEEDDDDEERDEEVVVAEVMLSLPKGMGVGVSTAAPKAMGVVVSPLLWVEEETDEAVDRLELVEDVELTVLLLEAISHTRKTTVSKVVTSYRRESKEW